MNQNQNIEFTDDQQSNAARQPMDGYSTRIEKASPDKAAQPAIDKQNPPIKEPSNQNTTEAQIMEVHHSHHPTHKKKWSEYLLEFFMLFFAVFLGFLVENYREHMIEE